MSNPVCQSQNGKQNQLDPETPLRLPHQEEAHLLLPPGRLRVDRYSRKSHPPRIHGNSTTGEPLPKDEQEQTGPPTEYDKLVQSFYSRLLSQRKHNKQMQEKNRRWSIQRVMEKYNGWNEMTIGNLHSLFLLFDNNRNGMLNYEDL